MEVRVLHNTGASVQAHNLFYVECSVFTNSYSQRKIKVAQESRDPALDSLLAALFETQYFWSKNGLETVDMMEIVQ